MSKKRIILVSKAAGGKDFFRDFLYKYEKLDISYTTRPPRIGEKEGYTYNYVTDEEFLNWKENDFFLEAVEFNNWNYGTSLDSWNENKVFIMTPSGVKCIPNEDRKDCIIVYFDIPLEIRRERLMKRSDADSVDRRILADENDFMGFSDFNIRVTNPEYSAAALYYLILRYEEI